jgi:hypothetical protein
MAPKSVAVPHRPIGALDSFDVLNELIKRSRRAWVFNLMCLALAALGIGAAFLATYRPLAVVYRSENVAEPALLVSASTESLAREVDAKRFFIDTANRLHGWNSANVEDQFKKAVSLMTAEWRHQFLQEANARVQVPVDVDQSGQASRLSSYIAARIRNDIDVDYDSLKCTRAEGFWHCKAKATLSTQRLLGPPVNDPKLKRAINLKASFQMVPTTALTLDGLLVSFWDAAAPE